MAFVTVQGGRLFYEERGHGVPILLIHPAGGTSGTWGPAADSLADVARVITYDRRGYARTGGKPVRSIARHAEDAAAILDALGAGSAVVVGVSVGATIALDLALHRTDLVRCAIAVESPWRAWRHWSASALATLAGVQWLALRGHQAEAAETFLRWAYAYPEGGSAWDALPEEWRELARGNASATLADVRIAIGDYPSPQELARIHTAVVCAHGSRSSNLMADISRSLAQIIPGASLREIEGAAHAVAFDAPAALAALVTDALPPDGRGET